MAIVLDLPSFSDHRGNLTVIEKMFDFDIKRVYYIYNVNDTIRGGHRHIKTRQILVAINGKCNIVYENMTKESKTILLDEPTKCLLLEPEDWHIMKDFSSDCILLVLASEYYDVNDYIDERY